MERGGIRREPAPYQRWNGTTESFSGRFATMDHDKLLPGSQKFLPGGYQGSVPSEGGRLNDPRRREESVRTAVAFVDKLRVRFERDERSYLSFIEALRAGPAASSAGAERLPRAHPHLLKEFHRIERAHNRAEAASSDAMGRWEDERMELNLVGRQLSTAIKQTLDLAAAVTFRTYHAPGSGGSIKIQDYFNAHSLTTIRRMFGEAALTIMDELRENPGPVISLLLRRLWKKRTEWKECSDGFRKIDAI